MKTKCNFSRKKEAADYVKTSAVEDKNQVLTIGLRGEIVWKSHNLGDHRAFFTPQVSEEAMEVLKRKIGILKHENSESSQRMAVAEKVRGLIVLYTLLYNCIKKIYCSNDQYLLL